MIVILKSREVLMLYLSANSEVIDTFSYQLQNTGFEVNIYMVVLLCSLILNIILIYKNWKNKHK